jgi:pimeloyl-ACP methyl ester carboxylesterase
MSVSPDQELEKVMSADGTPIAVWRGGTGQPLVLVHGTAADHTRWNTVRGLLEPRCGVYAVDRRGRGASGDAEEYSIEREYEDVVAVVDAVAQQWGGPVDLLGHSYGALCALEAALRTDHVRRLVLYEGPVLATDVYPPGFLERASGLLAEGRREDVLVRFFRDVVRMPDDQLTALRALPAWEGRVAAAHTIVREGYGTTMFAFDPARHGSLTPPTLLLAGGDSPAFLQASTAALADALPDAGVAVLEGQQHTAMDTAPHLFADTVIDFLTKR